jgi:hypothetical protein
MNAALVLAASGIDVSPNASGLPGSSSLVSLLGGLQFDAELAAIAAIIIGAAVWALSSHSNNYQGASRGRAAVVVSALAAVVIGFGPSLIEWFFTFGQSAH